MSMAACPSMEPARPCSACRLASSMSVARTNSRNASAIATIMIGPPTNSASVNCQEISRARMMPSSMTRLVLAISNAMAAVKLAPLRTKDLASATAAYEQDDEAAPKPVAAARAAGELPPSSRTIVSRRTTACTIADRPKPRISDQVISQVIDPATPSAWPSASRTDIIGLGCGDRQQLPQAVLKQRMRKAVAQPVEHHPASLAVADQAREPQQPQAVGHLVLRDIEGEGQIADAQLPGRDQREQDPGSHRIGQHPEQSRQPAGFANRQQARPGGSDPLLVNGMVVT